MLFKILPFLLFLSQVKDTSFLGQQMAENLLEDFDSALTSDGGSSPGQHAVLRELCSNDSEDEDVEQQNPLVKRPRIEETGSVVPKVAKPTAQEKKAAQRNGLVPIARVNQFLASLSDEEKTLLTAEGVVLPVGRAITKAEERELKQLRRKIKNKLSAQDSRRRRKEHMSTLEVENQDLRSQIQQLKNENKSLSSHLGAIQDSVGRRIPRGSRCVVMMMLLALSSQALPCAAASHELEAALPAGTSMMGNFSSATPTVPDYTVLSAAQSSLVADVLSKAGVTTKLPSMEGVECVVLRGNPERDVAWDVSMPPLIPLSELATGSH